MPVSSRRAPAGIVRRLGQRLGSQGGFTMIIALGVLTVTTLLSGAVFLAVQNDTPLARADLNGKQAYAAAQSGLQAYLYQLNSNAATSQWWETCGNDTAANVAVPGTPTATYSYNPVTTCSVSDPVGSLIDPTTGTLRMEFTGKAGSAQRTIVASLRTLSPLSFLWYTKYETKDSSLPGATGCDQFYYNNPSLAGNSNCVINWVTGDKMNGPMYTQDQFFVQSGNSPTFGRAGSTDSIASEVPTSNAKDICVASNCSSAVISNPQPNVTPRVPLPIDNSNLLTDAQNHGHVFTGTISVAMNPGGTTADIWNCPSSTSCTRYPTFDLKANPIIYASNGPGCSPSYDPSNVDYTKATISSGTYLGHWYGACGDIYIAGSYSTPLTVSAGDDAIITGNLTSSTDTNFTGTASPTGLATLGIVANRYVRIKHDCTGNPNVTVDGAILTLSHSFFVDNYDCGGSTLGKLTIHGAIAQYFRGIVGQSGGSGYLKNYNYDDRLALVLPPYLFDLQNTGWAVYRETLCNRNGAASIPTSCSYTGS
jgi:hypothetical protein